MSDNLTVQTRANYRVQLRRLWEIYKIMPDEDSRKPALYAQVAKLADKLGFEIDRLDVVLYSSRGRPRLNPDITDLALVRSEIRKEEAPAGYWTADAIEERAKKLREERERKSADDLAQMMKEHGGDNEGPDKATNVAGKTEGTS